MTDRPKPPRGRSPVEREWPDNIPDTPENVARAIMAGSPKKDWDCLKREADAWTSSRDL